MNVLEKILEEIDKKRESLIDMSNDEPELCDVEDWYDEGVDNGKIKAYCDAAEIIRSHMNEIPDCEKCSRRKWYQKGRRDSNDMNFHNNDVWISVEERLPEEGEKCIVTDKCGYVHDGIIYDYAYDKDENPSFHIWDDEYWQCFRPDVIAWQPLPDPYKPEEE